MTNLATLPADVIRLIILMEKPESIDQMRFISPAWNSMVSQTLSNKNQLPKITSLIWSRTENSLNTIKTIEVKRRSKYWGVDESFFELRDCTEVIKINDPKFAAKLRKCSQIVSLELNKWTIFDNIRDYLGATPVRRIWADLMTFKAQGNLLYTIRVNKVQYLEIIAHMFKKKNLHEFIIQSMEHLHSIKLFERTAGWNTLSGYVPPEVAFEELAQDLNNSGTIQAQFYPDNVQPDFHWLHVQRIAPNP